MSTVVYLSHPYLSKEEGVKLIKAINELDMDIDVVNPFVQFDRVKTKNYRKITDGDITDINRCDGFILYLPKWPDATLGCGGECEVAYQIHKPRLAIVNTGVYDHYWIRRWFDGPECMRVKVDELTSDSNVMLYEFLRRLKIGYYEQN